MRLNIKEKRSETGKYTVENISNLFQQLFTSKSHSRLVMLQFERLLKKHNVTVDAMNRYTLLILSQIRHLLKVSDDMLCIMCDKNDELQNLLCFVENRDSVSIEYDSLYKSVNKISDEISSKMNLFIEKIYKDNQLNVHYREKKAFSSSLISKLLHLQNLNPNTKALKEYLKSVEMPCDDEMAKQIGFKNLESFIKKHFSEGNFSRAYSKIFFEPNVVSYFTLTKETEKNVFLLPETFEDSEIEHIGMSTDCSSNSYRIEDFEMNSILISLSILDKDYTVHLENNHVYFKKNNIAYAPKFFRDRTELQIVNRLEAFYKILSDNYKAYKRVYLNKYE